MNETVVETARLIVRGWRDADVDPIADMLGDAQVVRYVGKGYQEGFSRDRSLATIGRMREGCQNNRAGIWPVELKATQATIGVCGLQPAPVCDDTEIAYLFSPAVRRRGYATEAASAVLAYAFQTLELPRVVAFVHGGNARSIAVLHRLGMRFDRVVRAYQADALRYLKNQ